MHPWSDLPAQLGKVLPTINHALQTDPQYLAFSQSESLHPEVTFGIKAAASNEVIFVTIHKSDATPVMTTGGHSDASFTLSALPEQWEKFFKPMPVAPFQSYWGMFGQNIHQDGVEVLGDETMFVQYSHVWRRVLELSHAALCGAIPEDHQPVPEEDNIVGRYIYITAPVWGRVKLFYEQSGRGKQDIVFLHTAGSDSRQYHGVMNEPRMIETCNMIAFDLPGHGRSFPSEYQLPGKHTNTEDSYVGCIREVIKALELDKPIVCGASMAGHVCLAVATRAEEVGCGGTIPCQGSEHLDMKRQFWDRSNHINQSIFNPEWVYGMMAPSAPFVNKKLIWHTYSAQAYGIFHGDLDFYFGGWDGRGRIENIDTKKCPVYMLTGEYDWSCTPELSEITARKIPGAKFKVMPELGHFPASENPAKFVGHLMEAIAHIQVTRT